MIQSMTGYGSNKLSIPKQHIDIEVSIRSINGRFLEPKMHMPREYYVYESKLREILAKFFKRGTIEVYLSRKIIKKNSRVRLQVQSKMAKEYLKAYKGLGDEVNLSSSILNLRDLLNIPDLIQVDQTVELTPNEGTFLFKCFEMACGKCSQQRRNEGESLKKILTMLFEDLKSEIKKIKTFQKDIDKYLSDKYLKRIDDKMKDLSVEGLDNARVRQEVVFLIDKSDIQEELHRLVVHLEYFESILLKKNMKNQKKEPVSPNKINAGEALGKKLDFYTQELLREINTIGSKTPAPEITERVVEAKSLIEKIKEQVQNIE